MLKSSSSFSFIRNSSFRYYSSSSSNSYKATNRSGYAKYFFWILPCTCFYLSYWQWKRLAWKEGLIKERQNQISYPISSIPNELLMNPSQDNIKKWEFRNITVSGEYLHDKEFHVGPRSCESQSGFHIITPFKLENGYIILVNRGWVKYTKKTQQGRKLGLLEGKQTLNGLLRCSSSKTKWTPENNPVSNYWFWVDAEAMAKRIGSNCLPIVIDLTDDNIVNSDCPIPGQSNLTLPNNHLNYMITWASLGIALSFMTFRLTRRSSKAFRTSYDAFGGANKKE